MNEHLPATSFSHPSAEWCFIQQITYTNYDFCSWMSPCKGRGIWMAVLRPEARLCSGTPCAILATSGCIHKGSQSPNWLRYVEFMLGSWHGDAALVFLCLNLGGSQSALQSASKWDVFFQGQHFRSRREFWTQAGLLKLSAGSLFCC